MTRAGSRAQYLLMIFLNKQGKWFFPPRPSHPQNPQKPSSCQSSDFPEFNRSSVNLLLLFPEVCTPSTEEAQSTIWTLSPRSTFVSVFWTKIRLLFVIQTTRTKETPPMQSLRNWYSWHEPGPAHKKKKEKPPRNTAFHRIAALP